MQIGVDSEHCKGRFQAPHGVAEVPLTPIAVEAFRDQLRLSPCSPYLFPSDENEGGHQKTLKTVWHATLRRAKIPYFRIYDLRSTYATRLTGEWPIFSNEAADEARSFIQA
jgi:integrase